MRALEWAEPIRNESNQITATSNRMLQCGSNQNEKVIKFKDFESAAWATNANIVKFETLVNDSCTIPQF